MSKHGANIKCNGLVRWNGAKRPDFPRDEKYRFFSCDILFDSDHTIRYRAWSQEFKNVLLFVSIASYMMRKVLLKVLKRADFVFCILYGDFGHFEFEHRKCA